MKQRQKFSSPLAVSMLLVAIAVGGCHSIARTHHGRLEMLCRAGDEIARISKKLQDIEQIMLYVGRIKDSPLADAALDVAIAIHGAPDEAEKRHADAITIDDIEAAGALAVDLLKRRARLEEISATERKKAMDESFSLYAMETKYGTLRRFTAGCSLLLGLAVAFLLMRKFF